MARVPTRTENVVALQPMTGEKFQAPDVSASFGEGLARFGEAMAAAEARSQSEIEEIEAERDEAEARRADNDLVERANRLLHGSEGYFSKIGTDADASFQAALRAVDAETRRVRETLLTPRAQGMYDEVAGPRLAGWERSTRRHAEAQVRASNREQAERRRSLAEQDAIRAGAADDPDGFTAGMMTMLAEVQGRSARDGLQGDAAAQAERSAIGAVHAGIVRQKANADPKAAAAYLDAHAPEIGDPQQVDALRTMLEPYLEEQEADRVVDTLRSGGAEGSRSAADDLDALLAQIDALNLPPRHAETARQRLIQQVGIETRMRTEDQREAADQVWAIVMDPQNTSISTIPPGLLTRLAPGEQAEVIAALRRNGQPDPAPDPVLMLELSAKAANGTLTQADLRRAWGRVPMADWERAANWLRLIEQRPQVDDEVPSIEGIDAAIRDVTAAGEREPSEDISNDIKIEDRSVSRAEYDDAVARARAHAAQPDRPSSQERPRSPQDVPSRFTITDGPWVGTTDNIVPTWQDAARFYGRQFGYFRGNLDGTATFIRLHPAEDTPDEATQEQPYVWTAGDWRRNGLFIPPAPQQRMPWEYISYAGRDYPTVAAAQAAGMPTIGNGPTKAELERAARDRAFISSIGQGPFGLGPIAYVMGANAENIGLSNQFDQAVGGMAAARAGLSSGRVTLPVPRRPGFSPPRPVAAEGSLVDLTRAGDLAPGFYRANPSQLRFGQHLGSPNFSEGGTISSLTAELIAGKSPDAVGRPIRVIIRDGRAFSLDNRRLVAFGAAGVDNVPIQIVSINDPSIAQLLRNPTRMNPIGGEGRYIVIAPKRDQPAARQSLLERGLIKDGGIDGQR